MRSQFSRRSIVGGIGAFALGMPAIGYAQQLLSGRTVRLVVEFGAGTPPDVIGRLLSPLLAEKVGGVFVVDPRPGGSGRIAAQNVATSTADGTTLMLVTGSQTVIAATDPSAHYDLLKDFNHVSMIAQYPFCLAVSSKSKYETFADLVDAARKNPGKVSYASAGIGTTTHLAMEMLARQLGISWLHVPYTTAGNRALIDTLAGLVDVFVSTPNGVAGQEGQLRLLAVTSKARDPILPNVPSASETVADYDVTTWLALAAPAATPANIVDQLNAALKAAIATPVVRERVQAMGFTPTTCTPEEMRARIISDINKWKPYASLVKQ